VKTKIQNWIVPKKPKMDDKENQNPLDLAANQKSVSIPLKTLARNYCRETSTESPTPALKKRITKKYEKENSSEPLGGGISRVDTPPRKLVELFSVV